MGQMRVIFVTLVPMLTLGLSPHIAAIGALAPRGLRRIVTVAASTLAFPILPDDSIIIESPDKTTWEIERKEYMALTNIEAALSFAPYLSSFGFKGAFYHAFSNVGSTLETTDLVKELKRDGYGAGDASRLGLIEDLIAGLAYVHSRGLPHLNLDGASIRIHR